MLGLSRSSYYYTPAIETKENLNLMKIIDKFYTDHPALGSRQMTCMLRNEGYHVNRKRTQRLMRLMGIEGICPKRNMSIPNEEHKIYPYLLRNVMITHPFQVWSIDITYIRMHEGFLYLVAILDWFSRYVLSWELSNTMTTDFCIKALLTAFKQGIPEIFNSDQGSQFTSSEFTKELLSRNIKISMDGKRRALDNIFIERLWRTVKYEEVYLKDYITGKDAFDELKKFFDYYNKKRPHSSLGGKTPYSVFNKL